MKHFVYALVDPHTLRVRYVGRTGNVRKRVQAHLGAATANTALPLYDWIRSLAPEKPGVMILQDVDDREGRRGNSPASPADAAEVKWMKRFEREQLFNSINRTQHAYRDLTNIKYVQDRTYPRGGSNL